MKRQWNKEGKRGAALALAVLLTTGVVRNAQAASISIAESREISESVQMEDNERDVMNEAEVQSEAAEEAASGRTIMMEDMADDSEPSAEEAVPPIPDDELEEEIPEEPEKRYVIKVVTNPEEGGTAIISDGNEETSDDGENIPEKASRSVTAVPDAGYGITEITVKRDGEAFEPQTEGGWEQYVENGIFSYFIEEVTNNYEFTFTFQKLSYTLVYTLDEGGKLEFDRGSNDGLGTVEVEYTESSYKITASVTDEKYHLEHFYVDGDDRLIQEKRGRDYDQEQFEFQAGIVENHTIEVVTALDIYQIDVKKTGKGSITADGKEVTVLNEVSGEDRILTFHPEAGYMIGRIQLKEAPEGEFYDITPDRGRLFEDGGFEYAIKEIRADMTIHVLYEPIPEIAEEDVISPGSIGVIEVIKSTGVSFLLGGEGKNTCYDKSGITLMPLSGKKIRLEDTGIYQKAVSVSHTRIVDVCYLSDEEPDVFGRERKMTFSPGLELMIDGDCPELILTEEEKVFWRNAKCEAVDISGVLRDAYPDRVVWSYSGALTDPEILEDTNFVDHFAAEGGNFRFHIADVALREGNDTEEIYLYAVDKAENCSAAAVVTVYRDGTPPELLELRIAEVVNAKEYGYFHNGAVTLQIRADDPTLVEGNGEQREINASGMERVELYAGQTMVSDGVIEEATQGVITLKVDDAFADLKELRLVLTDKVGNSRTFEGEMLKKWLTSSRLMLESEKPVLRLKLDTAGSYIEQEAGEARYWFKEIPHLSYTVSDQKSGKPGSGLSQRSIRINGREIEEYKKTYQVMDYASVPQKEAQDITVESLSMAEDGRNTILVQFTDAAGNTDSVSETFYLDRHKPEITGFQIRKVKESQGVLNILGFGNFSNEAVQITVSVEDAKGGSGEAVPSSGLKDVTLYLDGKTYQTIAVTEEIGQAVFTLPAETVTGGKKKLYLDKFVTAEVTDRAGNSSGQVDMTTGNSNMANSQLMVETAAPKAGITVEQQGYKRNGAIFNNTDTDFTVSAADADSGLRSVSIKINDTVLVKEQYRREAVKEKTYRVNTKNAARPEDGLYILTVSIVDNAGNETVLTSPEVYKDDTAPEILRFDMEAAGNIEWDGEKLSAKETDYGYYFLEDTKVTIHAGDGTKNCDSGVKEIHYYTVGEDGEKSETKIAAVDQDNKISFVVKSGFKGQVYACAYDYLENNTGKYVNPGSMVIETPEHHEREEHIQFQMVPALYRDLEGGDLYADDVNVDVTVTDTFSGIRRVEWSVESAYDTEANQSGAVELDADGAFIGESDAGGWNKSKTDRNLVTELKKTIRVSNNSNDITLLVTMTDRAGNASKQEIKFSIDKTEPEIKIEFDNETPDAENTEMYKESRVATVTVTERNFSPENIQTAVTNTDGAIPELSGWETHENTGDPDATTNTATITFAEDGDYTLEISGLDLAENTAESVMADDFTVDTTLPVITVTYDTENAVNGNYFATERTATIQIEEHNFSADRVTVTGTAVDGGTQIGFPTVSGFSDSGDIHTATIACNADGLYRFDVAYTDMAGNEAEQYIGEEYYVDMTAPGIEISGVTDHSANNGDVIPQISLSDTNYNTAGVKIELVGANRGIVTPEGSYSARPDGQVFTFANFPMEQSYDDIYTLSVTLSDMAGNESTDGLTFSVNRFGSVYVFDESLKKIAGTYIRSEVDVRLTEVNVDSLEHDRTRVVLNINGMPRDLAEGSDYTVEEKGGNGNWYEYDYVIDKSLFAGDGRYIVTLYSEDIAGNVNENIDESKKAEISFGVDKTVPVVIPIDIESGSQYPVDVKSATVAVNDNLVLEHVEIYIGEQECAYSVEGENYTFQVPGADTPRDIMVTAVDAAGNRINYVISKVLVTTNKWIRWYNNKPLFAGTLAGAAAVGGSVSGAALFLRKRRFRIK